MKYLAVFGMSLMLAMGSASVQAADMGKGKKVFNKCKSCHSLKAGKRKVGPSLHGMFGRKAGTSEGFKFSKAMKASDIVWDEKNLDAFLAKPREVVKGTKMSFPGLKKEDDRANLIAWLKENTK